MKITMKTKYIFSTVLFLMAVGFSCTDTSTYPIDFDELNNSNGGILKQIQQTSVTFDKTDMANAKYEVVLEANDRDRGKLFTKMVLLVKFVDRTPGNGDSSAPEEIVQEYQASEFTDDADYRQPHGTGDHDPSWAHSSRCGWNGPVHLSPGNALPGRPRLHQH
jgi:hypothetical protein